jgi:GPH family glycoside/pentoside/hexuronide:cation symporter
MPEPMPPARRMLYALGASGWQLTDRIVVALAVFFYLPPEGRGLEPQISTEVFLGVLTVFGIGNLVGRAFDAFTDLIVGWASDRSRSRFGRRRVYMLWGLLPMVILPVLLYWPPGPPGSAANGIWLAVVLSGYFIAFTVYVAPYLALMPEIAWNLKERVDLSTLMALFAIPAVLFGGIWTLGFEWAMGAGMSPPEAMRAIVVAGSLLALLLSLIPILVVDERRYCHAEVADLSFVQAVRETIGNRAFRRYLVAQLPFIVGVNLIQPAGVYYATVLLGRNEGFAAIQGAVLFAATLLAFGPVNRLARALGPKRTIVGCVLLLTLAVAILGLLVPEQPGGPHDRRNLALMFASMAIGGIAVAGFITMPNVILSQVIDYDTARTGANRAASYFGIQGFFTKFLYGVSGAILAFLFQRFGHSVEEPLGVILVGPVAAGFCLVSAGLFLRYPEREVLAATIDAQPDGPALPRAGKASR